jgi:aspartate/methionine/tyrosine aminotransferase
MSGPYGGALLEAAAKAHQYIAFSTPPHLQAAVAEGLAWSSERFTEPAAALARSRDHLAGALKAEGFVVLLSEATYFLCLDLKASGITTCALEFADRAVAEYGVAGIPASAIVSDERATAFCVCGSPSLAPCWTWLPVGWEGRAD